MKEELIQNNEPSPLDNEPNTILTNILANKLDNSQALLKSTAMTSSVASIMDDSTPSDSGVQLLDSMSSDMNESFMSNLGSDFDTVNNTVITMQSSMSADAAMSTKSNIAEQGSSSLVNNILPDVVMATATEVINNEYPVKVDEIGMTKSDIDNSNVDASFIMDERPDPGVEDIPDAMKTSTCSTFDTDGIVFRRKDKKTRTSSTSSIGGAKKRVSFHEDILKNTRTDNIHIEHGFITYNGYTKKYPHSVSTRYSWCSEGDNYNRRNVHYRNACSDVLDYGKTDLYEDGDNAFVPYDNSGVFEYAPEPKPKPETITNNGNEVKTENQQFYQCKCSSSNSSLDSGDSTNGNENPIDNSQKRTNYGQAKSSSCDCIGNRNNNNSNENLCLMTDNCYFSEPCFGSMDESFEMISPKSVWRKEIKPKSSCLKKTRYQTGVIPEYDLSTKIKKFNVHQDMNNLFGSLKNIFSMPLPERGVPEGCEDLQTVYECVPEMDNFSPIKNKSSKSQNNVNSSPTMKPCAERKKEMSLDTTPILEAPKPFGADSDEKEEAIEVIGRTRVTPTPNSFRNKFIVNCESTVFEHTGVFFENNQSETVQHNSLSTSPFFPATPQQIPAAKTSTLFSAAPFKQKLSNIFKSLRDNSNSNSNSNAQQVDQQQQQFTAVLQQQLKKHEEQQQIQQLQHQLKEKQKQQQQKHQQFFNVSPMAAKTNCSNGFVNDTDSMGTISMTSSMISTCSDKNSMMSSCTMSTSTNTLSGHEQLDKTIFKAARSTPQCEISSPGGKTRHLASPCRRKSATSKFDRTQLSPDLFCAQKEPVNTMVLLNEEFDDLLTITTTTESELNENEIEIVDYSASMGTESRPSSSLNEQRAETSNHFLRPPSSKSSLINRFLRNVTQKKINDATIKKNNILSAKYRVEPKLFRNLYVKLNRPVDTDMIADFNAEIAAEIETHNSACNSPVKTKKDETLKPDEQFGIGVGEVPIDIFDRNYLHILRDDKEILMKVLFSLSFYILFNCDLRQMTTF